MTVLTFPTQPQPSCFGIPPFLSAFIRLRLAGFDPDVALELAAAGYGVVGYAEIVDDGLVAS